MYEPHVDSAITVSSFLPLDGTHIRDLYLDQFYLRDPSLAFIECRMPFFSVVLHLHSFRDAVTLATVIFQFLDYIMLALAKVWTNTAKLLSSQMMWALNEKTGETWRIWQVLLVLGSRMVCRQVKFIPLPVVVQTICSCHGLSCLSNWLVE